MKIAPSSGRSMRRPLPLAQRKLRPGIPRTVGQRRGTTAQAVQPTAPPAPVSESAKAKTAPRVAEDRRPNALALRGGFWEIKYESRAAIVEDCRGLRYIALLIEGGQAPIHAKELVARATGRAGPTELELKDEVLDDVARRQLLERLEEIASERDRACAAEAFARAEVLDAEYERIAAELSRVSAPTNPKRRSGTFTDAGEKARKAVGKAISEAIARISAHPELVTLADHLSSTIRKGQWLSYNGNTSWQIDLRGPLPRK